MFSLIYLKLIGHPQLKDFEITFKDEQNSERSKPFSTVVIGNNGTGKSFLLRTIADIFRGFDKHKNHSQKEPYFDYFFHLRYTINDEIYEIKTLVETIRKRRVKVYSYLKNRPLSTEVTREGLKTNTGYEIPIDKLQLPQHVIVSSVMLNDRFTFQKSSPLEMYQYLGIRRTPSISSTKTFLRNSVKYLFEASRQNDFIERLGDILEFMGFEKALKIRYSTRYHKLFFTGQLSQNDLDNFYENWRASTNRSSPPWGTSFYKQLKSEQPEKLDSIINYLNRTSGDSNRIKHKDRSRSKVLEIDFFEHFYGAEEFNFLNALDSLNLLQLQNIQVTKKDNQIPIDQTSAGEYHLILSLLGLFSRINTNSLVLIDEPEISLHPKWQMQYINFLKRMFSQFPSCQFVITSHSHFLISDLEKKNSSVVAISRNDEGKLNTKLVEANTYGWSAEQVLLEVFKTPSTRNYYLAEELGEIFQLMAKEPTKRDVQTISSKVGQLRQLDLSGITEEDPLRDVLDKLLEKF